MAFVAAQELQLAHTDPLKVVSVHVDGKVAVVTTFAHLAACLKLAAGQRTEHAIATALKRATPEEETFTLDMMCALTPTAALTLQEVRCMKIVCCSTRHTCKSAFTASSSHRKATGTRVNQSCSIKQPPQSYCLPLVCTCRLASSLSSRHHKGTCSCASSATATTTTYAQSKRPEVQHIRHPGTAKTVSLLLQSPQSHTAEPICTLPHCSTQDQHSGC